MAFSFCTLRWHSHELLGLLGGICRMPNFRALDVAPDAGPRLDMRSQINQLSMRAPA